MEDIFNQIRTFIVELDPMVRVLIIGLLTIFGLFCLRDVVKTYINAKSYSGLKISPIIFTILFLFLAVYVASV